MIDEILYAPPPKPDRQYPRRAGLDDLVDEAFKPGSTGNANARELAEAFAGDKGAAEYLRARHNEAGGNRQDRAVVSAKPQRAADPRGRLRGLARFRNAAVRPLEDDRQAHRRAVHRRGVGAVPPRRVGNAPHRRLEQDQRRRGGGKMLANQRADHRILHFADGAAWRAYNERFGGNNAFDAMMGHIEGMSRDIAMMEILGPNPAASLRWLKDMLVKSAQLDTAPGSKAIARGKLRPQGSNRFTTSSPASLRRPESERIALVFSTIRSVQTFRPNWARRSCRRCRPTRRSARSLERSTGSRRAR
jgi:hypothetical protein